MSIEFDNGKYKKSTDQNECNYVGPTNSKGQPHGIGELSIEQNGKIIAEFVNGKFEGNIVIKDNDKVTEDPRAILYEGGYTGEVLNGIGFGVMQDVETVFENGVMIKVIDKRVEGGYYTGDVDQDGYPHGQGKMTYDDQSIYEGSWSDGKRDGPGIKEYKNGLRSMKWKK